MTNPRNQQLRTRYAAWDQPTTDYPIEIFHPEGAFTQIWRDYFFKPTQIRRSGTYAGQTVEAIRKYEYDALQRLCRVDEPETGSTVTGYDYNDNLTWSASGLTTLAATGCEHMAAYQSGRRSDRVYDARNRLSALSFPDGLGNQTWTYTKDGLPATITTYNGANNAEAVVNSYGYNKRRLLTSETISEPGLYTWPLGYGYDQNGNLAAQTYPTGLALTYSPNALGQATQVSTAAGSTTTGTYATGVSYYPNGAIKQFTYGNGVLHTMSQNARQLPDTVSDIGVAGYTYTYDKNGNTTQIVDNGQGANFNRYLSYDGLDRLTAAGSAMFGGSTHYINYGYDAIDNIRSVSHPGVREHSYWYNAKNQLTNVQNSGGASVIGLSYNPQGNLEYKNGQQHGFDYGNRLRWVMGKENYRYDGHGRRSKVQKDNGLQEWFQYSQAGQYLFSSKLTAGGVQTTQENVYLGGSIIAIIDHNWPSNTVIATKYQHTDALGSPVATTDASGALIERTNYESYGSAINKTVDGIGYTGHVMDGATGLTYMQQRYYDSQIGRFLSLDPVTADSNTGSNFNRYWYANNNPYRFTDPDGRQSFGHKEDVSWWNVPERIGNWFNRTRDLSVQHAFTGSEHSGKELVEQYKNAGEAILMTQSLFLPEAGAAVTIERNAGRYFAASGGAWSERFFRGSKYGARIFEQTDKFHAFPASVDAFAAKFGRVQFTVDGRGGTVEMLTLRGQLEGSKGWVRGTFEYIKNQKDVIYHRLFRPDKVQ